MAKPRLKNVAQRLSTPINSSVVSILHCYLLSETPDVLGPQRRINATSARRREQPSIAWWYSLLKRLYQTFPIITICFSWLLSKVSPNLISGLDILTKLSLLSSSPVIKMPYFSLMCVDFLQCSWTLLCPQSPCLSHFFRSSQTCSSKNRVHTLFQGYFELFLLIVNGYPYRFFDFLKNLKINPSKSP